MLLYHTHTNPQTEMISFLRTCVHTAKDIPTMLHQEKAHLIQAPSIIPHFIDTPSTQLGPAQPGQVQIKHSQHSKLHDWNSEEEEGKEPWGDTNPRPSHEPHLSHPTSLPSLMDEETFGTTKGLGELSKPAQHVFSALSNRNILYNPFGPLEYHISGIIPCFHISMAGFAHISRVLKGRSSHKSAFLFLERAWQYYQLLSLSQSPGENLIHSRQNIWRTPTKKKTKLEYKGRTHSSITAVLELGTAGMPQSSKATGSHCPFCRAWDGAGGFTTGSLIVQKSMELIHGSLPFAHSSLPVPN